MPLSGTYLICGGGAIGAALSRILRSRGAQVAIAGRSADKLRQLGCDHTFEVDFGKPNDVGNSLKAQLGDLPLRGLAYCVGSATLKPLRTVGQSDLTAAFDLNCVSAIETVRAALPTLKKHDGSVVLFSSVAVRHGFPNHVVISASKGAVEGVTLALAAELAPSVRVNCVAPSLTAGAAITAPLTSNEKMAKSIASAHPMGRLGEAEDSAHAAAFLLSDDSSWITGQILGCDGGRSSLLLR